MVFYKLYVAHGVTILFIFVHCVQGQVNDTACVLTNGNPGQCVLVQNCPSAVEMIRTRKGTPAQCGFEGKHAIVCCEIAAKSGARPVGEISKQKCRDTYAALSTRRHKRTTIVEGINAQPAEFPHMAILGFDDWPNVTWACAGILISEKYVLSAAHCVRHAALGVLKYVRVGDLDLQRTTDKSKPQDRNITRIRSHPNYRAPSVYDDIALLELSEDVEINDFVRPACLNTEIDIPDGKWTGIGWGLTSFSGSPPNHLLKTQFSKFKLEDCQLAYAHTIRRRLDKGIDYKSQICAGEIRWGAPDTCQGDSGGPLQIMNEFGNGYTVIGVTSFGKTCGIGYIPSVFSRVSYYIEWIESIVWPQ